MTQLHNLCKGTALVKAGKPVASICIPASADETVLFAALELQRYLEKISGARLPVKRGISSKKTVIRLKTTCQRGAPIREQDEFVVESCRDGVLLAGNSSRAVLYAVYEFLENLGCRWFYPMLKEEVIPRRRTIEVASLSVLKRPSLEYRGLFPTPFNNQSLPLLLQLIDWMAKNKMNLLLTSQFDYEDPDTHGICDNLKWRQVRKRLLPEIRKRGILVDMGEHNVDGFFPPDLFHKHPEWFSLIGKTRVPRQICYSNSQAVDWYAKQLVAYIKQNPGEAHIVGTWPRDGGNYCECSACKPKDVILKAVNRIAGRVRAAAPGVIVEYLAYTPQTYEVVKDTLPAGNVSVLVCRRDKMKDWIRHSARASAKGAFLFEYQWADNYNREGKIILCPADVTCTTNAMAKMGARGIVVLLIPPHNWWASGFNNYFFARAAWAGVDESDRWLFDYISSYYSEAARPMMRFFDVLREQESFLISKNTVLGCVNKQERAVFRKAVRSGRLALKEALAIALKNVTRTRICRCASYLDFYNNWITAQFCRQAAADVFANRGKAAKRSVLHLMRKVASLEDEMARMTRRDDPRAGGIGDGVLESELYCVRRTGRIELDEAFKRKVCGQ